MPKKLDLTNQRFGRLIALEEGPRKGNRTTWKCKCDCGAYKNILTTQLTRKRTQSCGCLQKERTRQANQSEDLSRKRYGRLTVIKRLPNSSIWECRCDCGNIINTTTNHLNSGHTQSCGCLQKERTSETLFVNLTGKKFGLLTVLSLNTELSNSKVKFYNCKCQCGKNTTVRESNLISGDTQSCGCSRLSHGEIKISTILKEYNIPFEMEKTFKTCINPKTKRLLRFDFYVNNQYLIEFDGIQHFIQSKYWGPLEDTQYRDNIKNQWCKENNIPLIRIPYTKLNTLTIDDLLL